MDKIPYIGEIAAIVTAMSWCTCSMLYAAAGMKIGSFAVNLLRLWVGIVLLGAAHFVIRGTPFPVDATWHAVIYLSLSGLIGLTLGDVFYLKALLLLGPRLGTLVMSMWPVFSTVIAWRFMGQALTHLQLLGIAITLGGIAWVVLERPSGPANHEHGGKLVLGVAMGVLGAMGQATAYILSAVGMNLGPGVAQYNALSSTMIRMLTGTLAMAALAVVMGRTRQVVKGALNRVALRQIAIGSIFGPFIGIWLSLVAAQHASMGVASTLISLVPIFVIPAVIIAYRRMPTPRAVLGAIVAVAGVAIIFLTK